MNILDVQRKRLINYTAFRRLELIYTLLGLLYFSTGLITILKTAGLERLDKPIKYSFLAISIIFLLNNFKRTEYIIWNGRWILPLIILNCLSFIWSVSHPISIESIRAELLPITFFGLYLALRYNHKEMFSILYSYAFLTLIISLFYIFVFPDIGKHPIAHAYPGAWKGILAHKNFFGFNLSILFTLLGLNIFHGEKKLSLRRLIYLGCTCVAIILSQSLGALIISILALSLVLTYQKYRWRGQLSVLILQTLLMISIAVSGIISFLWVPIMEGIGRSPTINGRTLIWEYVLGKVGNESPFLGFGRDSFWRVPALFQGIFKAAGDLPANAHNGYIELILDLGYIGLFLFIISAVVVLSKALKLAYNTQSVEDLWPFLIIFLFLIWNVHESFLLKDSSFPWLLFVYTAFCTLPTSKSIDSVEITTFQKL